MADSSAETVQRADHQLQSLLRLVRPRLPRIVPSHRPPSINLDASPPTLIPLSPSHACLSPGPELAHLHFRLPAYELLLDLASTSASPSPPSPAARLEYSGTNPQQQQLAITPYDCGLKLPISLALDRPWTSKHLQFIEQQAGLHLDPIASTDTLHIADDPPFCLVFATRSARSAPL
ncbi:hypothetical protein PaG_02231 [Moesziomyces aphidis]|uniref:Uncharacterized protein n=1 Tax=Moesziomyces aphidis TaxID=84754 RepID=W3VSX6_MOEAP|nr:hypothetical protein PaG_02231 [Moesziomyces aphidis]